MYRLKKGVERFDVVDGPFAGRKFKQGKTYADVPDSERHKFEEVSGAESKAESKAGAPRAESKGGQQ